MPALIRRGGIVRARRPNARATGDTRGTADERTGTSRRRAIAARGASAATASIVMLSRAVRLVTWLVVLVIVTGIVLRVLDANTANAIVHDIHAWAKTLIGPFSDVFKLHSQKTELAVNWGLAALVYLILGSLVAGLIAKTAPKAR